MNPVPEVRRPVCEAATYTHLVRGRVSAVILPLSHTRSPLLITHGDFTLLTHYGIGVQTAAREVVV
jgi:hypothetical protein